MAKKEDFSYEIFTHLGSVSHYVGLFSVCYQATNVSPSFLCVTVKQMLVQLFCVLLLTHGRFTCRWINRHTHIHMVWEPLKSPQQETKGDQMFVIKETKGDQMFVIKETIRRLNQVQWETLFAKVQKSLIALLNKLEWNISMN